MKVMIGEIKLIRGNKGTIGVRRLIMSILKISKIKIIKIKFSKIKISKIKSRKVSTSKVRILKRKRD